MSDVYAWAASLPEGHVCTFVLPRSIGDWYTYGARRRCYACDAWEPVPGLPTPQSLTEAKAQRLLVPPWANGTAHQTSLS